MGTLAVMRTILEESNVTMSAKQSPDEQVPWDVEQEVLKCIKSQLTTHLVTFHQTTLPFAKKNISPDKDNALTCLLLENFISLQCGEWGVAHGKKYLHRTLRLVQCRSRDILCLRMDGRWAVQFFFASISPGLRKLSPYSTSNLKVSDFPLLFDLTNVWMLILVLMTVID